MVNQKHFAAAVFGFGLVILAAALAEAGGGGGSLDDIETIVVLFEENHSFDNLFGLFPGADNLEKASLTARTQIDLAGMPYSTLPMLPDSRFVPVLPNRPWQVETSLTSGERVRAVGANAGSLTHRFYEEQIQINNGLMNKFVAISAAKGLVMSTYDMAGTEIWRYAQNYVLNDNFFHGAFGGSFLNHAWLVCACAFVTDANLDTAAITVLDAGTGVPVNGGDVSTDGKNWINTSFSVYLHPRGAAGGRLVQPQTLPHIGDRLDAKGISWKWYGEGYAEAEKATRSGEYGKVAPLFQWHHQPFAYFKNMAPGSSAQKEHLQDRADLIKDIEADTLPHVVLYKPIGRTNMHPSYTNIEEGDRDLKDIVERLRASPAYAHMLILITFDENGGFWDHAAPPKRDQWGPGTRIPLVMISPLGKAGVVDHTQYDTTSLLKTIEVRWDLPPLNDIDANAVPIISFLK